MTNRPEMSGAIGVFDSGVGGLTVVRAIKKRWPNTALIYLGDTARVPYGTKSSKVVERYALNCARFLAEKGASQIVIACNTASAFALPRLRDTLELPIWGMVEPGAACAAKATRNKRIGVIATEGTARSGSYETALRQLLPDVRVFTQACPLFVPLAEEGFADHPATRLIAEDYLTPLLRQNIDTLALGCTHYPLLKSLIREIVGPDVTLIDSADAAAESLHPPCKTDGRCRYFATDVSERVQRIGSAFLGEPVPDVELVDL